MLDFISSKLWQFKNNHVQIQKLRLWVHFYAGNLNLMKKVFESKKIWVGGHWTTDRTVTEVSTYQNGHALHRVASESIILTISNEKNLKSLQTFWCIFYFFMQIIASNLQHWHFFPPGWLSFNFSKLASECYLVFADELKSNFWMHLSE